MLVPSHSQESSIIFTDAMSKMPSLKCFQILCLPAILIRAIHTKNASLGKIDGRCLFKPVPPRCKCTLNQQAVQVSKTTNFHISTGAHIE